MWFFNDLIFRLFGGKLLKHSQSKSDFLLTMNITMNITDRPTD